MKNKLALTVLALSITGANSNAEGTNSPLTFNATALFDVQSEYFYRGLRFADRNEPVIGQTISAIASLPHGINITGQYFGNHNFCDGKYDETDALGNISKSFGNFTATLGTGFYHSPTKAWNDTFEVTASGAYALPKEGVTLSVSGGVDLKDSKGGSFLEVGATKSIPLDKLKFIPKGSSFDFAVTEGFNFDYFRQGEGLGYTVLAAGVNAPLSKHFTFRIYGKHQISHSKDFEDRTFGGASLNYSFK